MLEQYVVYKNPKDYPDKYVLRRWTVRGGDVQSADCVAVADSKVELLKALPPGLAKLQRQVDDDPVIEEIWI